MEINFYRGERKYYDVAEHKSGIYFTTDTNEIFTSDDSYGKNADTSVTTEDIIVAGGPLANEIIDNWPEEWNKDGNRVIPAGTTVQSLFQGLFLKPINGTVTWGNITWNPSLGNPTVTLPTGPVEIGSTVKCTVTPNDVVSGNTRSAICTASEGYFTSVDGAHTAGNKTVSKTGSTTGTLKMACSWNGSTVSNFVSNNTELKVVEGENKFIAHQSGITASVEALPTTKLYASTNTKTVLENVHATLTDTATSTARSKDLTSSSNDTVMGYYRWNAFATDSIDIVKTESTWKFTNDKKVNSVTASDQKYIVVLIPAEFSLQTASQMGLDFTGSFTNQSVDIKIGGSDDTHTYKMYYWQNTTGSNATVDNITIS